MRESAREVAALLVASGPTSEATRPEDSEPADHAIEHGEDGEEEEPKASDAEDAAEPD